MLCINLYICICVVVMVIIDYKFFFIYVFMIFNVLNLFVINMCCWKNM